MADDRTYEVIQTDNLSEFLKDVNYMADCGYEVVQFSTTCTDGKSVHYAVIMTRSRGL